MVDTTPKWLVSVAIVSIAVLTLIFSISIESLSPKSNLQLTVLEWKNFDNDETKLDLIIKNVGALPANNIVVVIESDSNYFLSTFNSTESIPQESKTDENFRIELDRLSSSSFSIINLKGVYDVNAKKISLFSDGEPKFLRLLESEKSFGATTIDIFEQLKVVLWATFGMGLILTVSMHYFLTYYKESFRKHYLGSYNIKHVSYDIYRVILGLVVLGVATGISAGVGYYASTTYYMNYGISDTEYFGLSEQINHDVFLTVYPSGIVTGLLMFIGIMFSVLAASPKMYLPRFYWFLKPKSFDTVTVLKIDKSWLDPNNFNLFANVNYDSKKKDIFTVTKGTEVIGLLSTKEIKLVTESGKQTFKEVLLDELINEPKFDKEKIKRENFCEISQDELISDLKKEMENSRCRFAVIRDSTNKIVGIADYDLIF